MYRVHPCKLKLRQEASEVKTSTIEILPDNRNSVPSPDNLHEAGEDAVVFNEDESDSDTADAANDDSGNIADTISQGMIPSTEYTRENGSSSIHANALKKNMNITYSLVGDPDKWYTGSVKRRTGKAKGKYRHFWAIENDEGNEVEIDFENGVSDWKQIHESVDSHQEEVFFVHQSKKDTVLGAKAAEIKSWHDNNVFKEVPDGSILCINKMGSDRENC